MNTTGFPAMGMTGQPLFGARGSRPPRRDKGTTRGLNGSSGDTFKPGKKQDSKPAQKPTPAEVSTPTPTVVSAPATPEVETVSQASVNQKLDQATHTFTAKVMDKLAGRAVNENLIASPFNTFLLGNTLVLGSVGNTQSELADVMGLGKDVSGATRKQLATAVQSMTEDLKGLEQTGVKFKNGFGIWKASSESWKQSFLDNMALLKAKVDKLTGSAAPINQWASDSTDGKITDILKDHEVAGASMVLGAATYFDAPWRFKMKDKGYKMQFHGAHGTTQAPRIEIEKVAFNHLDSEENQQASTSPKAAEFKQKFPGIDQFGGAPAFQAFTLPYGKDGHGNELKMSIFLPKEEKGLKDVYGWLAKSGSNGHSNLENNLNFLKNDQLKTKIQLIMPKFKTDSETDTGTIMKSLGVNNLFVSGKCDFSEMAAKAKGLFVSKMKQKAFIEVDKEGTRGGAVDVAVVSRGAIQRNDDHRIDVDRPFLYVVHDNKRPIMLGTVNDVK